VRVQWRRWREENAAAIEAYNRHAKGHGPFAEMWLRY
jgi:post-segregation antitoxin (ccd killing protein)